MALENWHPLRELESMKREMDRIWEDIFPGRAAVNIPWRKPAVKAEKGGVVTPPIDIIEKNNEIIIKAEMPGVARENIEISMQESVLTIKGELKEEPAEGETYSYSERNYRFYARALNIPFKVSEDNIKANLKDGILYIHMPKAEEQPRKIKVDVAS